MKKSKQEEVSVFLNTKVNEYARYSVQNRAIPSLEDGLKPIHRYVLWALHQNNHTSKKARIRSLAGIGEVMSFSSHGDSGAYDAIVSLSNDSKTYKLLDGEGSFGSVTSNEIPPSSARYTSTRLSKLSEDGLLSNIKNNAVDMIDNYSEDKKEPVVLPSRFPVILVNPSDGIATGFRSFMPSYNMKDVFENVNRILDGKKTKIMYPDLPTRGQVIENKKEALKVKETGKGEYKLRAKYIIQDNMILIKEIPYTTNVETIVSRIIKLKKDGELKDIIDINDTTDKEGLEIEILLKNSSDKEEVMAELFAKTSLENNFNVNNVVLLNGQPKMYGTDMIIKEWISFRKKTIDRISENRIGKNTVEMNILEGILKILNGDITKAIKIIRGSKNDEETLELLSEEFNLDKEQATYVMNIRLKNLNKEYLTTKTKDFKGLQSENKALANLIKSDKEKSNFIKKDLKRILDDYGVKRQTEIVSEEEIIEYTPPSTEDLVEDYNVKVFVTKELYLKKIALTSLRGDYKIRVKQSDEIIHEIETTNGEEILVFTDKQNVYKKRLHEIEDARPSDLGIFLPSELDLEKGEKILHVAPLNSEHSNVIIGYSDGKVAKIDLEAYRTKQNRSVLRNAYADKRAILFKVISGDTDLMAISSDTKTVLINTEIISSKATRATQGNNFIRLRDGEQVDKYIVGPEMDNSEHYRVKSAGVGKNFKD